MTDALTEEALFELLSLECRVDTDGSVRYFNSKREFHRVYGPAIEYSDGSRSWYQNGQLTRLDGPAVERPNGYRAWWQNGQLHRNDGPAIEYSDGSREWYQNGQLHRLDGPAFEGVDGSCEWYINGIGLTKAEWQQAVASMWNV